MKKIKRMSLLEAGRLDEMKASALKQVEALRGQPLDEAETIGFERAWSSCRAAIVSPSDLCYADVITPFKAPSGRRIAIAGLPCDSSPLGIELVVREVGPAKEEVSHA